MLVCSGLLWFLVRSWELNFGGAGTASVGLSQALTYLAHGQAGLYLASPLPCWPEESRFILTISRPPGNSPGRLEKSRITLAAGQR